MHREDKKKIDFSYFLTAKKQVLWQFINLKGPMSEN